MIYRYDIILINYVLRKDEESEIMQTLRIEHLTKTYGEKTLFEDADFIINEHDRIGLIGTNGSGKTTLLNAISGIDPADSGELIAPNDYRIGYLKQMPELDDSKTIIEAVLKGRDRFFKPSETTKRRWKHTGLILKTKSLPSDIRMLKTR